MNSEKADKQEVKRLHRRQRTNEAKAENSELWGDKGSNNLPPKELRMEMI